MHRQSFTQSKNGFTIVELIVVIIVIAVLAGIIIVGYGQWRTTTAEGVVKNDLTAVGTAMENTRNFGSGYATNLPSGFSPSQNTVMTYVSGDGKSYCIEAYSTVTGSAGIYSINSNNGSQINHASCPRAI